MLKYNLFKLPGIGLPKCVALLGICLAYAACKTPVLVSKTENRSVPAGFNSSRDTVNLAAIKWQAYFSDPYLAALIDTALQHNQELNITLQEIEITKNEIRARKGEYLPFVGLGAGAGIDKSAEFTRNGAVEKNLEVKPGTEFPEPLGDVGFGLRASWEVDIWKKLRN